MIIQTAAAAAIIQGPGLYADELDRMFFQRAEFESGYVATKLSDDGRYWPTNNESLRSQKHFFQVLLSGVSMHLHDDLAQILSKRVTSLLDEDNWDDEDSTPSKDAFSDLLGFLSAADVQRCPSLGTDGQGSISAFWHNDGDRLTLNFRTVRDVRWVLAKKDGDQGYIRRAAGYDKVQYLPAALEAYEPDAWFAV